MNLYGFCFVEDYLRGQQFRSYKHIYVCGTKPVIIRNIYVCTFSAALLNYWNKGDANYFDRILFKKVVMKSAIWKQICGLKHLGFLLLFSSFTQSTIQKGFHLVTHLPSVTESNENVDDSNVEMNQSGRCSNAEDYSQVII